MRTTFLFFYLILITGLVQASSVRSQFFVSALNSEMAIRNSSAVFLGFEMASIGAFVQYEAPYSYVREEAYGLAFRTGQDVIFEAGAGPFKKKFESTEGTGVMGYLSLGKRVAKHLVISYCAHYKEISKGDLERRTALESYPTVGFDWAF
jgi:hypothetical protein